MLNVFVNLFRQPVVIKQSQILYDDLYLLQFNPS